MEHLPTETMHGVGEKEQLKIFRINQSLEILEFMFLH